ncbi:hypothetical protein I6J72_05595 [Corynebacterium sp. FDAARGOS 1242]|uniref:hypothetical protein n=1 Tax=Corynebacterium sp. FDAARGOS 1242 TaxID=2778078 RepID=UPI0019519888|nr:hypothetical protein [Corynebacterium sp. FDAARGOS 1242]QRP98974.1 hypothetical protein I6J72_05595 [Corynebacterium sp. FDAARGOS 1242]
MNDREKYEFAMRHCLIRASDAKAFEKILELVCYHLEDLRLSLDLARGNRERKAVAWATLERLGSDMDSLKLEVEEARVKLKDLSDKMNEKSANYAKEIS